MSSDRNLEALTRRIAACRACRDRFAATATAHEPRPVVWLRKGAPILVAAQAPGAQVHRKGRPFDDASGRRLRQWMGVDEATFYDRRLVAVLPMAFCFPGYDERGSDLPPPPACARLWHEQVMQAVGRPRLLLLVGGHAQKWHLGAAARGGVTRTVAGWQALAPAIFPLPHPSWRNTAWLKRNPWFAERLLPALRRQVAAVLAEARDRLAAGRTGGETAAGGSDSP